MMEVILKMSLICDQCGCKTQRLYPIDYDSGSGKCVCIDCFNKYHHDKLKIHKIDKEELIIKKPDIINGSFESVDKIKELYGNLKTDVDLIDESPYPMSKKGWYKEQHEKIIEKINKIQVPKIGINGKLIKDSQKERGGDKKE